MSEWPAWHGIFPAICTPFKADGAVDEERQRAVARFAVERGAHGIVCFGLAGEVSKLTASERKLLTDAIIEEVGGAVPVLIGSGAESVGAACELARYAESAGADGIVIPPPVSARPGEGALIDYLVSVASSVSLPVMIQDAPAYLGVALGPRAIKEAASRAGNIVHVKLEAGPTEMSEWLESLGESFGIWGGEGGLYQLDSVRIGVTGIIPGVDLVDLLVEIYEADRGGEAERAEELFAQVLPILAFEIQSSIDHFNACAKRVLAWRGVLERVELRQPADPLSETSERLLAHHFGALDLARLDARASSAG